MKKNVTTAWAALLTALCMVSPGVWADGGTPRDESPKFYTGQANPLLDFVFVADPTSVEYNGRLYVYGTNDSQQLEAVGKDGKNTYERIHSLVMMSTDDMVNWTYHGIIDVKSLSPWGIASWAPSIVSRVEADGKTHFYLYYSNSGAGVGMLTATSPVGPWVDPLGKALISPFTQGLGDCEAPFDPGVVIDDQGTGWLAFGAGEPRTEFQPGNARLVRLGKDLMSLDSELVELDAPYHFEANELNFINGTWVYTYNTSWKERTEWPYEGKDRPTVCSMCYMTSHTPLDRNSWKYEDNYFKNPMDYGMGASNNHTHLHKYKGDYYLFYHNLSLQEFKGTKGGFRSLCVNKVQVDEQPLKIHMGEGTMKGVDQIKPVNPFIHQQAETVAATLGVGFEPTDEPGNMLVTGSGADKSMWIVRGVFFSGNPVAFYAKASGHGKLEVHLDKPDGPLLASVSLRSSDLATVSDKLDVNVPSSTHDLYFVFKGGELKVDEWMFER